MPRDPDYFKNKTILITGRWQRHRPGRGSDIRAGRRLRMRSVPHIDPEAAERTANQVIQLGAKASFVACDVTVRADVDGPRSPGR